VAAGKRELADLLEGVGLFSRCSSRERRTIARHAQTAELPSGTQLMVQGEPGDALFVIFEGSAIVQQDGETVREVGTGSYFGELAILDGAPRSATVVATSPVKVAVIGIRMFRTLLREIPDLAEQLLVGLAAALRASRATTGAD
jgi:CRP/FNR family transcriptional regulator, cyclic AMP receptor protein